MKDSELCSTCDGRGCPVCGPQDVVVLCQECNEPTSPGPLCPSCARRAELVEFEPTFRVLIKRPRIDGGDET
jgi:hypothetical protein